MHFGKNDCSTIEIDQFEPICSYPTIDGTTPLTLDVPVPTFLHPVPPNECACFTFNTEKKTVVVNDKCETGKEAECWVDISQADPEDCCSGLYNITPHVEVPCIPFSLATAYVYAHTKDGGLDTDGALKVEINEDCCTIKPVIDITLPKCIKNYETPPATQITYLDHGVKMTHTFMTMQEDGENCTVYPVIHPWEQPCPLADSTTCTKSQTLSNVGGSLTVCAGVKDCAPVVDVTVDPINVPAPCYCDTTVELAIQYKDSEGTTQTKDVDINLTPKTCSDGSSCYHFTQEQRQTIDLTGIGGGGVSSGGDVNPSSSGGGTLWVDGSTYDGKLWYMGGFGDRITDAPLYVFQRGEIMRGGVACPYGYKDNINPVPFADLAVQKLVTASLEAKAKWRSNWYEEDEGTYDDPEKKTTKDYATGDLSVVMPTAYQWHERGVASVMSHFIFNAAGILNSVSEEYEPSESISSKNSQAVLLAPAPAVMAVDSTWSAKGDNASGLAVMPADFSKATCKYTSGLSIKAGDGMRIFNINDGTTPEAYLTYLNGIAGKIADMQGELEVHYGEGLRVFNGYDTSNNPQYLNYPSTAIGALTINKCDKDFEFHSKSKSLVLNDKRPTGDSPEKYSESLDKGSHITQFTRDSGYEYSLTTGIWTLDYLKEYEMVEEVGSGFYRANTANWGSDVEEIVENILTFLDGIIIGYMHITESGVVLGLDGTKSAVDKTRHASEEKDT